MAFPFAHDFPCSWTFATTPAEPGRDAGGGGLYLSISGNGGKRWVFLYTLKGKRREMGLGSAARGQVSLADARKAADWASEQVSFPHETCENQVTESPVCPSVLDYL